MSVATVNQSDGTAVGFTPNEVDLSLSTRSARLKWVIVVNSELPPGRAANAAVCAAAPTVSRVPGLLGADVLDATGSVHPALPWVGCSVLTADPATLRAIREKAASYADTFVADMPAVAQHTLVYTDYAASVENTDSTELDYCAVSIVGPRNRVSKIVGKLPLMG
ncbi:DUF2000 domain-containing protein [Streptomyces sp. NPDC005760]|uniref:DUF2000 domain-containing protein n=1 Tax=Streptomyces sp. NPDC005760 TaxID=3156718 RepID=UPI0034103CFA